VTPPRCQLPRGVPVPLAPLRDAVDGRPPRLATAVTLLDDGERLVVEVVAHDPRPWATIRDRDGDLWTEEVIELFLAPGDDTPRRYFELEINPLGTLFDAAVDSPHGDRRALAVDRAWSCAGLESRVEIDRERARWRAVLAIPWTSVAPGAPPDRWRLNVYRIDRPPDGDAEFSAWSPTFARPADFHRPACFGFLARVS
jgi:hypothetical protein